MKCVINDILKERIKGDFPSLETSDARKNRRELTTYTNSRKREMDYINSLLLQISDNNISDSDFFINFLSVSNILLNIYDVNDYCRLILGDNYDVEIIKTKIPNMESSFDSSIEPNHSKVVRGYASLMVAVGCDTVLEDREYTVSELITMHKNNIIIPISYGPIYKEISLECYEHHQNSRNVLEPFDATMLSSANLIKMIKHYPKFLKFVRHSLTTMRMDELINDYHDLFIKTYNDNILLLNDKVENYDKRLELVKSMKK